MRRGNPQGKTTIRPHTQRDPLGRLRERLTHKPGSHSQRTRYHYDAIGRLTKALANHAHERFAFDPAHNLIDPESTPSQRSTTAPLTDSQWADYVRAHLHDPNFNPLQTPESLDSTPEHWGKIADNRLKTWQDHRYQYDAWGNCVEKRSGPREIQHYTWDGEHQLIQAYIQNRHQRDDHTETWHYAYDPFDRRIAKWQQGQSHSTTHYTWDGNRLLAESNQLPAHTPAEAQTRHTLYLYEPDSFVPLAQVESTWEPDEHEALRAHLYTDPEQNQQLQAAQNDPFIWNWHVKPLHQRLREQMGLPALPPRKPPLTTHTLYYHTDHLGTPRELTDSDGQIVWAATYKAWGSVQNIDYPPILRTVQRGNTLAEEWVTPYPHERPVQNLRFQGQYCDEETGLHYNRFRYYDPECGRFVSQDPIGLFGGDNFYQYAPNPVEWIDAFGLKRKPRKKEKCCTNWDTNKHSDRICQGNVPGIPGRAKYYRNSSTGEWWSPDKTGHGGSAWKVFDLRNGQLEWKADADEIGNFIERKHKGPVGKKIKINSLKCKDI